MEIGSAEEQYIKNMFDGSKKCRSKGYREISIDISDNTNTSTTHQGISFSRPVTNYSDWESRPQFAAYVGGSG